MKVDFLAFSMFVSITREMSDNIPTGIDSIYISFDKAKMNNAKRSIKNGIILNLYVF
mgnify:CR=1 FL=1